MAENEQKGALAPVELQAEIQVSRTAMVRADPDPITVKEWAAMISGSSFVPKHLCNFNDPQKQLYNICRVVEQACRWGISPYAACDESFISNGKLGFSGKLVAAIVETRSGLAGRLTATYQGSGADLVAIISGTFKGEAKPSLVTITLAEAITSNEWWRKMPHQMLFYAGARKWARQHKPGVILGVYASDEIAGPADGSNGEVHEERTMPYADQETIKEVQGGVVSGESAGPGDQTLQEALAAQAAPVVDAIPVPPDGPADVFLVSRLSAELDLFLAALKIPPSPDGSAKRREVRDKVFAKFGVTKREDLTQHRAQECLAWLAEKVVEIRNQSEVTQSPR